MTSTSTPVPAIPPRRRLFVTLALLLGSAVTVILGMVVLGAFLPDLYLIGVLGSALSGASVWLGAVSLLAVAVCVRLLARRRSAWRIVIAAVATVSLIGYVVITSRLVAVGHDNQVAVSLVAVPAANREPDVTVQYAEHDGQPLNVSIWGPTDSAAGDAPVAFFTHGGGWIVGDPTEDAAGMFTVLNDAGWLVVSAQYTLADHDRHTVDSVEAQVGCAMAWTAAHAGEHGGDAATFVSLGDSAGGNLAINSAYRANAGDLTCDSVGDMPRVSAVSALFPGVNPYALYADTVTGGSTPGRTFMEQYIGGSPKDFPEEYRAVDSSTHITAHSPPTLILQGENDHLVQAHSVYAFADEVRAAGVDVTLVRVPHGEHVFQATPLGAELYTKITMRWLRTHGLTS